MFKLINFSSTYFKGVTSLLKGTFWAQVLGFFGTLYVAKLYGADDFGLFSKFMSLTTILSIFYTFRLESAIVLYDKKDRVNSLFYTVFKIIIFASIITLCITFLIPKEVYQKFNFVKTIALAAVFGAVIKSLETIYINYLIKENKFNAIAIAKVLYIFLRYTLQISFFFFTFKEGLIAGFLIASLLILFYFIKKANIGYKNISNKEVKVNILENVNLVSFGFLSDNLNTINLNMIPIIAGIYFKDVTIGWYFLAITILSVSVTFVSSSFSKIFFLKTAEIYNQNKENLFNFIKKSVKYLVLLLLIPMLFFLLFGDYLIDFFLAEKWGDTGVYIKYLAFLFFLRGVYNPLSNLEEVYRKNHIGFIFNLYLLMVNIAAIYFGNKENDFLLLIKILSIFCSLGYLVMIFYFLKYSKKLSFKKS